LSYSFAFASSPKVLALATRYRTTNSSLASFCDALLCCVIEAVRPFRDDAMVSITRHATVLICDCIGSSKAVVFRCCL
jgi:hypothetical protein